MRSEHDADTILDTSEGQAVTRLLSSREWSRQDVYNHAGLVKRLQMMRIAGLPPMRVVAAAEIERLGRIPRSTDTDAKVEDALDVVQRCGADGFAKAKAVLTFFSHQWLRPNWCEMRACDLAWGSVERAQAADDGLAIGDVDSADREKARALVQWAKWLKSSLHHRGCCFMRGPSNIDDLTRSDDLEVYFWIDFCSALQNTREAPAQIVPYMAALPAYVAVCALVTAYWTEGYASRAWCQAEMLMGCAFVTTGTFLFIVPRGFEHAEDTGYTKEKITVPDAATAQLTNEADRPVVAALTETARRSQAFTCERACARNCEIECSPGSIGTWLGMNVCLCGQCCGFLPWARTRNVQPGKKRGMGRLAMVIPASPAGAPQPAEMARGPGDAVQLLG